MGLFIGPGSSSVDLLRWHVVEYIITICDFLHIVGVGFKILAQLGTAAGTPLMESG